MKQTLKCERCGVTLAELEENKIVSHGVGIRIDPRAYAENLAWAICDRCSHQTAFDATWFKAVTNT